jgi:hypothetical protein
MSTASPRVVYQHDVSTPRQLGLGYEMSGIDFPGSLDAGRSHQRNLIPWCMAGDQAPQWMFSRLRREGGHYRPMREGNACHDPSAAHVLMEREYQ